MWETRTMMKVYCKEIKLWKQSIIIEVLLAFYASLIDIEINSLKYFYFSHRDKNNLNSSDYKRENGSIRTSVHFTRLGSSKYCESNKT